jgi:hypothetical protein
MASFLVFFIKMHLMTLKLAYMMAMLTFVLAEMVKIKNLMTFLSLRLHSGPLLLCVLTLIGPMIGCLRLHVCFRHMGLRRYLMALHTYTCKHGIFIMTATFGVATLDQYG